MFTDQDIIYKYTRKEAIEDGVLIDVSKMAQEVGFKFPIAITAEVNCLLHVPKKSYQSYDGRLWDVLFVLMYYIAKSKGDRIYYTVKIGRKNYDLKAICHGDDECKPVITIMLKNQD